MTKRGLYILLSVFLLFANILFAQETVAESFQSGTDRESQALRDFVIDETLRRLALQNAQARRKEEEGRKLRELVKDETLHRFSARQESPQFFFTLQKLAVICPRAKVQKKA